MPALLCWTGTSCEQPVPSCAGCVLTRGFTEPRKESGYLFEKSVTNTLYWKVALWWINCEQCCTSKGVLKSQCWPQMCVTASAVHLRPAAQSWEGRWSAPRLLRHATFAWLDYSSCLVPVHFSGIAAVEWARITLATRNAPVLQFICFCTGKTVLLWGSLICLSSFVGMIKIWRGWLGLSFRNLKALHIVKTLLHWHW